MIELSLLNCLTQLGILSDMKISVNPNKKIIGKLIATNNSIEHKVFYLSYVDQLSKITLYIEITISY